MATNIQLVIVDDQYDFMDNPDSALPVPGGNADADRVAELIRVHGHRFSDIHVTLDSHHPVDVGHPTMWLGADGTPPPPFTAIKAQDIKDRLKANTEELIRRGGFGSPTLYVNGEDMYFGNDRLPLLRAALLRGACK